jgi:hypothetical protein
MASDRSKNSKKKVLFSTVLRNNKKVGKSGKKVLFFTVSQLFAIFFLLVFTVFWGKKIVSKNKIIYFMLLLVSRLET